jgi:hypothetical protein
MRKCAQMNECARGSKARGSDSEWERMKVRCKRVGGRTRRRRDRWKELEKRIFLAGVESVSCWGRSPRCIPRQAEEERLPTEDGPASTKAWYLFFKTQKRSSWSVFDRFALHSQRYMANS